MAWAACTSTAKERPLPSPPAVPAIKRVHVHHLHSYVALPEVMLLKPPICEFGLCSAAQEMRLLGQIYKASVSAQPGTVQELEVPELGPTGCAECAAFALRFISCTGPSGATKGCSLTACRFWCRLRALSKVSSYRFLPRVFCFRADSAASAWLASVHSANKHGLRQTRKPESQKPSFYTLALLGLSHGQKSSQRSLVEEPYSTPGLAPFKEFWDHSSAPAARWCCEVRGLGSNCGAGSLLFALWLVELKGCGLATFSLPFRLSVSQSSYLSICLSLYLSLPLSIYLSLSLSSLSLSLSLSLSFFVSIWTSEHVHTHVAHACT